VSDRDRVAEALRDEFSRYAIATVQNPAWTQAEREAQREKHVQRALSALDTPREVTRPPKADVRLPAVDDLIDDTAREDEEWRCVECAVANAASESTCYLCGKAPSGLEARSASQGACGPSPDVDASVQDVLAAVAFVWSDEVPEDVYEHLADPDEKTLRRLRQLLRLRAPYRWPDPESPAPRAAEPPHNPERPNTAATLAISTEDPEWGDPAGAEPPHNPEGHIPSMVSLCEGKHPWDDEANRENDGPAGQGGK
jgi:hypothetical protein